MFTEKIFFSLTQFPLFKIEFHIKERIEKRKKIVFKEICIKMNAEILKKVSERPLFYLEKIQKTILRRK